jgi:hemolysin activation/secretion protein
VVLTLCGNIPGAAAQTAPAPQAAPAPAAAPAAPVRTIDIDAYDIDGNTLLPQSDVEDAVYPYLGPSRTRADIEEARRSLERAYQAHGFQSVIVQLPPQTVAAGIVKMHVVEASVGTVKVTGAKYTSPEDIAARVPSLQAGKVPDFNQAQKELAELNRGGDRQVTPALKPGHMPGTVDVDLKVNDNLPVHGSVELNNDHSPNTTPLRTTATVQYSDLWDIGHTISATAILAPQRLRDAEIFSGSYTAPLPDSPWTILLYGYTSNSDVATLGSLDVLGKGYTVGVRGILQLPAWDDVGQSLNFGFDYKHSLEHLSLKGATASNSVIDYVPLTISYSAREQSGNSFFSGTLSLTAGIRGIGSSVAGTQNNAANATPNFVHANIDLEYLADLGSDFFSDSRITGQVADGAMLTTEQFASGGLASVRGYLQSEAIGDDGFFASEELRTPTFAPYTFNFVDEWRFFVFSDAARLRLVDPGVAGQATEFSQFGFGMGTRMSLFKHLALEGLVAFPLRDGTNTKANKPYAEFSAKTEF